ncbi:hypothetical protein PF005_g12277 [Phytophthora fragariae]|uniref:Uncharacterized protein n=1 Tax=Phytophthora fragariae TaxID=53985 RepID=A0A6A3E764_9STRA|nr:hypothetical protein PF003_g4345 [Phytophthora fragariae]KAE8929574.1 hypothetical protein PF009_g20314 [Phytophthora fragariae]KAE8977589.1 hypothetical protein PF011_g23594 [Phytophthora fragariae]KAE9088943.1 hypothetical protein PF007_g19782 [Phytophthora fragariae]KAE9089047.1 hypothetical protein PF010_g19153 [Phytophthora fragariae]
MTVDFLGCRTDADNAEIRPLRVYYNTTVIAVSDIINIMSVGCDSFTSSSAEMVLATLAGTGQSFCG